MLRSSWLVAVLVAGCSATSTAPAVSVSGEYPLTPTDVRAIEQLVAARSDIQKPLESIHTDRPNHAQISSGTVTHRVGSGSVFTVAKHHGHWVIDLPVEEDHIIFP
jgi:hypothetical protein